MPAQPSPAHDAASQPFRFLKQFNDPPFQKKIACRDRLRESDKRWFPGDYLSSVFARALCDRRAIPFKEVLESFEFFACVRKQIKPERVADFCCGHGLVGILFAMFERHVEQVLLLDKARPVSYDSVLATAIEVAPWVRDKVKYIVGPLAQATQYVEQDTAIVAVHACGQRTDQCIEHAIYLASPLAVLPCCRDHGSHPSPPCLKQAFGGDAAIDIDRTYRLFHAHYRVRWDYIPAGVTPMNRVLIGIPQHNSSASI